MHTTEEDAETCYNLCQESPGCHHWIYGNFTGNHTDFSLADQWYWLLIGWQNTWRMRTLDLFAILTPELIFRVLYGIQSRSGVNVLHFAYKNVQEKMCFEKKTAQQVIGTAIRDSSWTWFDMNWAIFDSKLKFYSTYRKILTTGQDGWRPWYSSKTSGDHGGSWRREDQDKGSQEEADKEIQAESGGHKTTHQETEAIHQNNNDNSNNSIWWCIHHRNTGDARVHHWSWQGMGEYSSQIAGKMRNLDVPPVTLKIKFFFSTIFCSKCPFFP